MFTGRARDKDGEMYLVVGLTPEDIDDLKSNRSAQADLRPLGIKATLLVVAGASHDAVAKAMRLSMLPEGVKAPSVAGSRTKH